MKIKFLGAAGTVTGSSYALTSHSGNSILVDLGMFQGLPEIEVLNNQPIAFDLAKLDGVVLTHAHLDHCGRLPKLMDAGFRGKIWMTPGTRDLAEVVLLDSARVSGQDVVTTENLIQLFQTIKYHQTFTIGDFEIKLIDAGHILGSATAMVTDTSDNRTVVFSGDLGNTPHELLTETEVPDRADVVVMESTYGNRNHPNENAYETIAQKINLVESSGGALLIPTFALEKTQEMLHIIKHLKQSKKIQSKTPVFLDSPMAQKATNVYRDYRHVFKEEVQQEFNSEDPFGFPGLIQIKSGRESNSIYELEGSKVIIAGSGMMTGGRILSHAIRYLPQKTTQLLIMGYQGEGTLGREILEGSRNVIIEDRDINIRAAVSHSEALSSHADQKQLLKWLSGIAGVQKVILTHGEDESRQVFSKLIEDELGVNDVSLPQLDQELVI